LRNDTEHKFQEVTRPIRDVRVALNEGIDAHSVATRNMTARISQEMGARSGRLLDDMME